MWSGCGGGQEAVLTAVCPIATQPVTPVEPLSTAATAASATATAIVTATISTTVSTTTTTTASASVTSGTAEYECRYLVHTVGSHQQLYTPRPLLLS
jgi:hypothetical protein